MRLVYIFIVEATGKHPEFEYPPDLTDFFKSTMRLFDAKSINESLRVEQEARLCADPIRLLVKKIADTVLLCAIVRTEEPKDAVFYRFFARITPRLRSERNLGTNRKFSEFVEREFKEFNALYGPAGDQDPAPPELEANQKRIPLETKVVLFGINRGLMEGRPFEVINSSDLIQVENENMRLNRKRFKRDLTKHVIFGALIIVLFFGVLIWHRLIRAVEMA